MTVTQAVRGARLVLEKHTPVLWIEGEVASLVRASSGHLYFDLKDDGSQLAGVMWRSDAQRLRFRIQDGQKLRCHGRLTIYERGGRFQFAIRFAEPAGLGADALALEQLKRKLAAEGLFDRARKRPLPGLPRRIGVVTSKSGAAIRDIIRTVHRRFPVPILIADATVQGATAPRQLVRAMRDLAATDVDVIIIGRGGGSAGDLAA
ncbi:MAG: exodeoxyribonuclease VII large subunit, partial [Myxococcota bacterium]